MVQVVQHLIAPATLPTVTSGLSVLSYNILLPNSVDGWWNYKMYLPPLSKEKQYMSSWEYRKSLLRERINSTSPDVVCFQEVSPLSFYDDFSFMNELGYDSNVMFKKGRFRPATFWKSSKCELASPPVHKDRTLLTAFRLLHENLESTKSSSPRGNWYILNCHLQAGKEGKRRLRQINEGVRAALTLARKLKEKTPETYIPLIVCGDFNGNAECAAVRYLEDGFVDETFVEDGEQVTSSRKEMPIKTPLLDVATTIARPPPNTLVVPELISLLVKGDAYENPELSDDAVARLTRIYNKLATKKENDILMMQLCDVEKWLTKINGQIGRGSEFRAAARQMGWTEPQVSMSNDDEEENAAVDEKQKNELPNNGMLSLEGFINVYQEELRQGKFWGIAHDLAVLEEPLPHVGVYKARFDRMYCSLVIKPVAILDFDCSTACPNEMEPSDHLPVAASFVIKSTT